MQEINRATKGISSMHINHEGDEIDGETEYSSEYNNEDDGDSEPMPGAFFTKSLTT